MNIEDDTAIRRDIISVILTLTHILVSVGLILCWGCFG